MHHINSKHIDDNNYTKTKIPINHLAFVDDTCWIANSKQGAIQIFNTALSFFRMTDIEINYEKTEILRITPDYSYPESFLNINNNIKIRILPLNISARYLGVWLRADGKPDTVINMTSNELKQICSLLRRKHITDKQTIYIFNSIIAPAIEYRTMLTYINKSHVNSWNKLINITIRIKASLPNIFPTAAIKHPNIYNTCDIEDLQAKSKTSELYI
jgi:hypothetical protein